jgi:tRNA-dihydrouridine synthase A
MVTAIALLNANKENKELSSFSADFSVEDPVVLQLGGACPANMREAALIAQRYGYKEFNINVGCPSPKVAGAGSFGAALMREAELVGEIAAEIRSATGLPTTVKCRIGVNDDDSYHHLAQFIKTVSDIGGVEHFIVHARKAILDRNFSPADNRKIPPLNYPLVYSLCKDFPSLEFTINGGIVDIDAAKEHLANGVSGVMVGRAINDDPFHWVDVDRELYGEISEDVVTKASVIQDYAEYAGRIELVQGKRSRNFLIKPIMNLFRGDASGKLYRASLSTIVRDQGMSVRDVILKSAEQTVLRNNKNWC